MAKVQSQVSADTNDAVANSVSTQTFGASFTAGNCVWGHATWRSGDVAPSSVDDNGGNIYTVDQTTGPDANGIMCTTFHKENIVAVASPVVTVHWTNATNDFRRVHAEERNGIATTSALNKKAAQFSTTFGTGTDAVTSGAQTTTVDGCQVVGVAHDISTPTIAGVGTGYASTDSNTFSAGDAYRAEDRTQAVQGSIAATFTTGAGTDDFHVHMLAFAPAVGGGGGNGATLMGQAML